MFAIYILSFERFDYKSGKARCRVLWDLKDVTCTGRLFSLYDFAEDLVQPKEKVVSQLLF